MKVRLYRGPFDGKVLYGQTGGYHILVTDKKKMSRKQLMDYRMRVMDNMTYIGTDPKNTSAYYMAPAHPMVTAEYARTQFVHPDGSVFYEWTGYSKPYGPQ